MPIVEYKPNGIEPSALSPALDRRVRQQKLLAELGVTALQGASFNQLLDAAARLTAEGMEAEFCKILEHIPAEKRFLVRAGVGWGSDIVGVATIGDDLASPAGFAVRAGLPVISNHLESEERFRTPRATRKAWHSSRNECHLARRGQAVWGAGGRQPVGARVQSPRSFVPPGRSQPLGNGH